MQGGECNRCNKKIIDQRVNCSGLVYHYDCFYCDLCFENIAGKESFMKDVITSTN